MRKLIFFAGPAAAGKTTLAAAAASRRRIALFDMDTLLRPAAERIMAVLGADPSDRDSPLYKRHCRDLGYRIAMDAALDNVRLGTDSLVIGPFTRELEDKAWLAAELARIGASTDDADVKVVYVYLERDEAYRERLLARGSALDAWKLDHWDTFRRSLEKREVRWPLQAGSVLYLDNTGPVDAAKLDLLDQFLYGNRRNG